MYRSWRDDSLLHTRVNGSSVAYLKSWFPEIDIILH